MLFGQPRQGLEGITHALEGIAVEDLPAPERAALHLGEPRLHNNLRPGHEDRLDLVLDDVARHFLTPQNMHGRDRKRVEYGTRVSVSASWGGHSNINKNTNKHHTN